MASYPERVAADKAARRIRGVVAIANELAVSSPQGLVSRLTERDPREGCGGRCHTERSARDCRRPRSDRNTKSSALSRLLT